MRSGVEWQNEEIFKLKEVTVTTGDATERVKAGGFYSRLCRRITDWIGSKRMVGGGGR